MTCLVKRKSQWKNTTGFLKDSCFQIDLYNQLIPVIPCVSFLFGESFTTQTHHIDTEITFKHSDELLAFLAEFHTVPLNCSVCMECLRSSILLVGSLGCPGGAEGTKFLGPNSFSEKLSPLPELRL